MKKRTLAAALLCVMIFVFAAACGKKQYNIIADCDDYLIDECPEKAAEGETVTVYTAYVTDAELYLTVDGVDVEKVNDAEFKFVMPARDVTIHIYVDTSNSPGA